MEQVLKVAGLILALLGGPAGLYALAKLIFADIAAQKYGEALEAAKQASLDAFHKGLRDKVAQDFVLSHLRRVLPDEIEEQLLLLAAEAWNLYVKPRLVAEGAK